MSVKILYISPTSQIGGGEQSLLGLLKTIDRKRFIPLVLCPGEGPLMSEIKQHNIDTQSFSVPRLKSLNIVSIIQAAQQLMSIIEKEGVQLIHGNGSRVNLIGGIAGRLKGVPVIWHCRNLIVPGMVDWERIFLRLPSLIITNSYAVSKRFSSGSVVPPKVRVVYNGVDIEIFSPKVNPVMIRDELKIGKEETLIGLIGRIGEGKGHKYFLQAAQLVTQSCNNCRFLIVGDTIFGEGKSWKDDLIKLANDLKISSRIIFTGYRSDVPHIMASLDILVLATEAEPFGRVLIEAMASGKPVVATNAGGVPEVVIDGKTGFLISPRSSQEMADAIVKLIKDSSLRNLMGEAGRQRAQDIFNLMMTTKCIEELYSLLLNNKG